jgi:hypothetical protein
MRRIDALRTLALSSALILAVGGTACASEEDAGDTGEPSSVDAAPPAEAPEDAANETGDTGESPSVEAAPPAEASEEEADETSPPADKPDTAASEPEEE